MIRPVTADMNLIQGLRNALGASQFGGTILFSPAVSDPAAFYSPTTLTQLALEIDHVDKNAGSRLGIQASLAIRAQQDAEQFRSAWIEFKQIISGYGTQAPAKVSDPIAELTAQLKDPELREKLIDSGLDTLKVSPYLKPLVLKALKKMGPIELKIEAGDKDHFYTTLISEKSHRPELKIILPKTLRVFSITQLKLLAARAAVLAELSSLYRTLDHLKLAKVSPADVAEPIPALNDAACVMEVQDALKEGRFSEHLKLVPTDREFSSIFAPSTLFQIAKAVAKKEPNVGAQLYVMASRADAARRDEGPSASTNRTTTYAAWKGFTKILREPGPIIKKPLIEMDILENIIGALDIKNSGRRDVITAALTRLCVPKPDDVLDSIEVNFGRRLNIYPVFHITSKKDISVSVDTSASDNYITVDIDVPRGQATLSEEEVLLLIARALLIGASKQLLSSSMLRGHSTAASGKLERPVPILVLSNGVGKTGETEEEKARRKNIVQLGPPELPDRKLKQLSDLVLWLASQSNALLFPYEKAQISLPRGVPNLMGVPNISSVLLKMLSPLRGFAYSFIFKMVPDGSKNIRIKAQHHIYNQVVNVEISPSDLSALRQEDLIDILLRAVHEKEFGSYDTTGISLPHLREGFDLTPEILLERSALKLAYIYQGIAHKHPRITNISGQQDLEYAKRNLSYALRGLASFNSINQLELYRAAWDDILRIRQWHIQSAGILEGGEENVVDVIPQGDVALVHAHGDASFTSLDWLYILSVMAANPARAIRVHLKNREVLVGSQGDAKDLYSVIAANWIFKSFDLFDEAAKMPKDIVLGFPGGVPPSANPHFSNAPEGTRKAYIRALRWFTTANMSSEWKPRAGDTRQEVKSKTRAMSRAWHPDRRPKLEQANLFSEAIGYFRAIEAMYEVKLTK